MLAIVIGSVIVAAAATTIFQVVSVPIRTSNHMTAVKQVQNAGYWISHDTQMAQTNNPDPEDDPLTPGTEVLTLAWIGWERLDKQNNQYIDSYRVRYTYHEEIKELRRLQTITTKEYDKYGQLVDEYVSENSTFIANYITAISIPPMVDNKLTVTIVASVGEAEEERTYEIMPRPGS